MRSDFKSAEPSICYVIAFNASVTFRVRGKTKITVINGLGWLELSRVVCIFNFGVGNAGTLGILGILGIVLVAIAIRWIYGGLWGPIGASDGRSNEVMGLRSDMANL